MTPADLDEDVRSTLLKLRADGHKLAVGSSSKNAPLILERIGLGSFFDAVADGTQITHSKPDPEVFLLAAKLLSVKPEDVYKRQAGYDVRLLQAEISVFPARHDLLCPALPQIGRAHV